MADLAVNKEELATHPAIVDTPLVEGKPSLDAITDKISRITETKPPRAWYVAFAISATFAVIMVAMFTYVTLTGIGVWGNNQPVAWGWPITNFVWWIGIGHAGTLISAILHLLRQRWRTSINRAAEAMTIFAVMCAGLFPLFHTGRPWRAYWMFPIPNFSLDLWQNFRSPLIWDVFAVSTYFTVSVLFWYTGLIPDLATLRDRAKTRLRQVVFAILSLGWRGSARHWQHYELAYLILAGLSTPLVLSVHSIVSFDFAVSILPGWHTTIFPPYFVAGAIFSGFAMVLTLLILARKVYRLEDLITMRHIDNMCKVMLATGLIVGYAYSVEYLVAWLSGNPYERFTFWNRLTGPYWWATLIMMSCNVLVPQLLWFERFRRNVPLVFVISILVNIGMWFERYVIIVTSLHRDFLPSSWGMFEGTIIDVLTYAGTLGFFMTCFLLFMRYLPVIAISEVKGAVVAEKHAMEMRLARIRA